jgi:uncharacterized protein YdeI (YjbR/CyaY-like superfamily)
MEDLINPLDFVDRDTWRSWLEEHHDTFSEAWLIIQKKASNLESLSLNEAVEEAICFGWIDGKLHSLDDHRYLLRFSPRKQNSVWSVRNIQRVEELESRGVMTEAGLDAVRKGKKSGQWRAAIDRENTEEIPSELEAVLRRTKGAIAAYRNLPDSKKKQYMYWVQSAKREQTKLKRIKQIVKHVIDE